MTLVNEKVELRDMRILWFNGVVHRVYSLDHLVRPDDFRLGRRAELMIATSATVPTRDNRFVLLRVLCGPDDATYSGLAAAIELLGTSDSWAPDTVMHPTFTASMQRTADDLDVSPEALRAHVHELITLAST